MKKIIGLCLPVMLGAVLTSRHAHTADNLTSKRKLIIPACTVTKAEVDWGNMKIQTLSQNKDRERESTMNMQCLCNLGTMKVTITATNTQNNNSISVPNTSTMTGNGLFIYFYSKNQSGSIGSPIVFNSPFPPGYITGQVPARNTLLYAKLGYKGNIQNLRAGTFSATVTLVASYS